MGREKPFKIKERISPPMLVASEPSDYLEQVTVRMKQRPQEPVTLSPLHLAEESEDGAPPS